MSFRKIVMLGAVSAMMAGATVAQAAPSAASKLSVNSAAAPARVGAPQARVSRDGEGGGSGSIIIALLAAAAVIGGIIIAADNNNTPTSG